MTTTNPTPDPAEQSDAWAALDAAVDAALTPVVPASDAGDTTPEHVLTDGRDAYLIAEGREARRDLAIEAATTVGYAAGRASLTAERDEARADRDRYAATLREILAGWRPVSHGGAVCTIQQRVIREGGVVITRLPLARDLARWRAALDGQDAAASASAPPTSLADALPWLRELTTRIADDLDRLAALPGTPTALLRTLATAIRDDRALDWSDGPTAAAPSSVPPPARREPAVEVAPARVLAALASLSWPDDRGHPGEPCLPAEAHYRAVEDAIRAADGAAPTGPVADTTPAEPAYLIWSHHHKSWWGPNGRGYRRYITDAGRYTLADTKQWLGRTCDCCPVPEVVIPAPSPDVLTTPGAAASWAAAEISRATKDVIGARARAAAEELPTVGRWPMGTITREQAGLPPVSAEPTPAPAEPLTLSTDCTCGHTYNWHQNGHRHCEAGGCRCREFVRATPAPAADTTTEA